MKKNNLIKTLLCCSLLGGVGIVGTAVENNDLQAVRAEDEGTVFNDIGKDMTDITTWSHADGTFVEIEDWLCSGKALSFEFKFNNYDAVTKTMYFNGFDGDKQISTYHYKPATKGYYYDTGMYALDKDNSTIKSSNYGSIEALTGEDVGWYRYTINLAELGLFGMRENGETGKLTVTGHETLNKISFANTKNDYWADLTVRRMKVVDTARRNRYIDAKNVKNIDFRLNHLIGVPSFGTSNSGVFIEFKPTANTGTNVIFANENGTGITSTTYIANNSGKKGKTFDLGDGWIRYELMPKDLVFKDDASKAECFSYFIVQWGGTYDIDMFGASGLIDCYSANVTLDINGTTESYFAHNNRIDKKVEVSGKHFVGWATGSADGELFDFENSKLTDDTTLYAKLADHDFATFVEKDDTTHTYVCECGEENTESHTFTETVAEAALKTAATCTEDAVYYKSCECGQLSSDTFTDTGSAKGHNVNNAVKTNKVEATCEETGVKEYYKCPDCGVYFEDAALTTEIGDADALATWLAGDGVIDANGHDYGDLIDEVPATFDAEGVKAHYECADCGKKFIYEDNAYVEVTDAQLKIDATGPALKEAAKDYLDNYVETHFPEADYTVYAADIAAAVEEAKTAIDEATDEATIEAIKAAILEDAAKVKSDAELVEAFDDAVEALVDLEYEFSGQSFGLKQDSKTLYNAAIAAYNNLGDQAETLLAENTNLIKLSLLSTAKQYVENSQSGLFGIFLQQAQLMGSQARFDELCGVLVEYANAMMAAEDKAALQTAYSEGRDAIEAVNIMFEDMIDELGDVVDLTKTFTAQTNQGSIQCSYDEYAEFIAYNIVSYQSSQSTSWIISYIDNMDALTDTLDAVEAVLEINAIGTVEYTAASKALIDDARTSYDSLTDGAKARVTAAQLAVLTNAEAAYAELEAAAQSAANAVVTKINAIGTVEYTAASKALIDEAREAYDALTAAEKLLVPTAKVTVLTNAEAAYATLKAAAETAAAVVGKIDAIGTVEYTDASKALIDDAREAYDALSEAEKGFVASEKLDVLTAAEASYASLKAAAEAAANKGGCGGSIAAVSAIASGLAFAGLALLGKKRKED